MKNFFCRRYPRSCAAALLAGMLVAQNLTAATNTVARPNIIFILADDLGYGDVGAFYQNTRPSAQPRMYTPQLDTMASQGMMFRQHYSASPVCAPARASLLLGQHQGNCVIRDNQFDKALPSNHTLATVLKQAGYYCGAIGKWGLAGQSSLPTDQFTNVTNSVPGYPLQHGFDEFFGFVDHNSGHVYYQDVSHPLFQDYTNVTATYSNIYSTDLYFARAKMFVTNRLATSPNQPFFLYLAPTAVHAALQVPGGPFPAGSGTNGGLTWPPTPTPVTADTWIHPDYTNAVTTPAYFNNVITSTNWSITMKRYATMDRRLDDGVGDLLQLLRDLNIASNTLVIFSSDNGPANESDAATKDGTLTSDPRYFDSWAKMDGIKRDLWEAGVREPTIAWWPGAVAAGSTNDTISAFWDWLPTFADVTGQVPPAEADGVSLLPTLTGAAGQRSRGYWYFEYYYNGSFAVDGGTSGMFARKDVTARNQLQSLRTNNFVAVRYNIQSATDPFRLFDVVADPHEDNDISGVASNATLLATMSNFVAQVRMVNSSASRPYDTELMPPVTGVSVTNGALDYAAYTGTWPWVPDLDGLTAVSTGKVAGLSLAVAPQTTNYGVSFRGYVMIPTDGQYTFYLTDDDGAEMWIHEAHVIDDDFNHTGAEVGNSILLRAGLHPLRLFYRHGTGTATLGLQYSGPGITKQVMPLSMLYSASSGGLTQALAQDDSASTLQNTPVTINVLANDLAGDGPGPLRVVSVGTPLAGVAATNASGQVVYTPNTGFLGDDKFTYTMSDGVNTASATVRVGVGFTDGMIWFPFNQTSGLSTSDAGGAYTANLIGFTNDPAEWVTGKWNTALQFNGSNNYVTINNYTGIVGSASRTVAAWVKTTSSGQQPVIAWGPNSAGNKWTFLVQNGHARIEITSGYLEGSHLVNDGQWHLVACTYTNNYTSVTNAHLYVDGNVETSFSAQASLAVNTTSSGSVLIGSDVQSRYFNGTIDEPRIYNRALSATEIQAMYAATNQSAAAWYHRYYGDAAINWNTPDVTGLPCLLDYAMGAEPATATPAQLGIQGLLVTNSFQVRFPRHVAGTSELIYQLQVSSDLKNWSTWPGIQQPALPLAVPGMEQAVYQASSLLTNTCYIRLQVSLP